MKMSWDQDRVRTTLWPFKVIASTVKDNGRTSYTEAGGEKLHADSYGHEPYYVNTYSAIKAAGINAVFACNIKQAGEEPEFKLSLDNKVAHTYHADEFGRRVGRVASHRDAGVDCRLAGGD